MTAAATMPYAPYSAGAPSTAATSSHVSQVKKATAGVSVQIERLGIRKSLSKTQCIEAAEAFSADGHYLTASKKLLDTKNAAYKGVTTAISQARHYWQSVTFPYPIAGIRLIRKDQIEVFNLTMTKLRNDLNDAVTVLQTKYDELREEARERLGDLYDPAEYPAEVASYYRLSWHFPNVEPPDYLKDLHPDIYKEMQAQAEARIEAAIGMAEQALTAELHEMVSHMVERLSGNNDDGKPKIFRDSAVENLKDFFKKFENLNLGGNAALTELVQKAENLVAGVDPKDLRKEASMRELVSNGLGDVMKALDTMLVDKPTRQINTEELED